MQLKCKENLLETEITKMKTKLKRIEELMRKKNSNSSSYAVPAEIQRQIQDEIDKLNNENNQMKERNKKLRAIEKELNIKHVTKKAPANKYSHVKGKLNQSLMK
jgi:TolA-binding protein